MIRMLLFTLLFFFGPALLMFALHRCWMLLRLWLRLRHQQQEQQATVIDITPQSATHTMRPGVVFIVTSLVVGFLCAWLAWHDLQSTPQPGASRYIPAHVDAYGNMVPGQSIPKE